MELLQTVKGPDCSGVVRVNGEIDMSSLADVAGLHVTVAPLLRSVG
jgi:hypothetical protein